MITLHFELRDCFDGDVGESRLFREGVLYGQPGNTCAKGLRQSVAFEDVCHRERHVSAIVDLLHVLCGAFADKLHAAQRLTNVCRPDVYELE